MIGFSPRLCARAGVAAAALGAAAPAAASEIQLFTPDTVELTAQVRVAAATGERSWLDGGFGKAATSGNGDELRVPYSKEQIKSAPNHDIDQPLSVDDEA